MRKQEKIVRENFPHPVYTDSQSNVHCIGNQISIIFGQIISYSIS